MPERIDYGKHFYQRFFSRNIFIKQEESKEKETTKPLEKIKMKKEAMDQIMQNLDYIKIYAPKCICVDGHEEVRVAIQKRQLNGVSGELANLLDTMNDEDITVGFVYGAINRKITFSINEESFGIVINRSTKAICVEGNFQSDVDQEILLKDAVFVSSVGRGNVTER
jgi:hypothetical protein